jgi:hypothetical protein
MTYRANVLRKLGFHNSRYVVKRSLVRYGNHPGCHLQPSSQSVMWHSRGRGIPGYRAYRRVSPSSTNPAPDSVQVTGSGLAAGASIAGVLAPVLSGRVVSER